MGTLGRMDGRERARERRRRPGFPPPSTVSAKCRVQALGLMARIEQVGAASSPAIAVRLDALATVAREASIVGVAGIRSGATGLGFTGRRASLVGCHWRQAQKIWELQVTFV